MTKTQGFKTWTYLKHAEIGRYNVNFNKCIKINTELILQDGAPVIEVWVNLVSVRGKNVSSDFVTFKTLEEANTFIKYFEKRMF